MRTTIPHHRRLDPLNPRGIIWFLVLVAAWAIWSFFPRWEWSGLVLLSRVAGYGAAAAMALPYVHILLRTFRSHPARMSYWLRWHIAAAYAGFFFLLVHCQARGSSLLTHFLIVLTWFVMVSGVSGFYGQKFLYALLPSLRNVPEEYGLERLEPERARTANDARDLRTKLNALSPATILDEFTGKVIDLYLSHPFRFWTLLRAWLSPRRSDPELPVFKEPEERDYVQARLMATDAQGILLDEFWELVKKRRGLNQEYLLHQIGRLWLFVHGPAAWLLLVLVLEHVLLSVWYGGW